MKKLLLIVMLFVVGATQLKANDTIFNAAQFYNGQDVLICFNKYDKAVIYPPEGCSTYWWYVGSNPQSFENPLILDGNENRVYICTTGGCGYGTIHFNIAFIDAYIPNETTTNLWKHQHESISLSLDTLPEPPDYDYYEYLWNTGATTSTIEVTEPGTYTCGVSDMCATSVQTFIVQDNVEIDLATCDLESNLNLVTWSTSPAQAQYIDHVIVKRDGLQVGTAPYSDGQFTDNIGSGSASRTYTITAVATDGTECPIVSYPKETIHMSYTLGMNSTIEIGWNTPTGYDLLGYNICEWHEDDGSLSVIDFVGASVTSYTCSESQFDEGYIVVQGVENGKTESRLLSNRSIETVGIEENQNQPFKVYPNPANGIMFVETVCTPSLPVETYRIVNPIGQTVMEGQITMEKHQIDVRNLPNGMYFITVGGATRKFVVE